MDSKIICAIISALGVVLSSFLSRVSAHREIKRLKMEWDRADSVSFKAEIAEAVGAAAEFEQSANPRHQREAVKRLAAVMVKADGEMRELLVRLYEAVRGGRYSEISKLTEEISAHAIK